MLLVLTADQKAKLSIAPVDAYGNPAQVENVAWTVSDPSLLAVADLAPDGLSAYVVTQGPVGVSQVVVKADVILGEGVQDLVGVLDVEVIPGQAANLSIATGSVEPK